MKLAPLCLIALALWLSAPAGHTDVLRGHLSGVEPDARRFDIRLHFYPAARGSQRLAERQFTDVLLSDGYFEVPLDPASLPGTARFVEIAIRPSNRPYAIYRRIPPRRRLERTGTDLQMAARSVVAYVIAARELVAQP